MKNRISIPHLLCPNLVDGSLVWKNIPHASLVHTHNLWRAEPLRQGLFRGCWWNSPRDFSTSDKSINCKDTYISEGTFFTSSISINHSIETSSHVTLSSSISSSFKDVWVDLQYRRRFWLFILVIHPSKLHIVDDYAGLRCGELLFWHLNLWRPIPGNAAAGSKRRLHFRCGRTLAHCFPLWEVWSLAER